MENKLEPEFKTKWLEALRSGEYKQAQDYLKTTLWDEELDEATAEVGYCCLGVAGKICGLTDEELNGHGMLYDIIDIDSLNVPKILALPYRMDVKGKCSSHISDGRTVAGTLANMNDDGKSFEEIADWIEENL